MLSAKNRQFFIGALLACTLSLSSAQSQTAVDQSGLTNVITGATSAAPVAMNLNTTPAKKLFGAKKLPDVAAPHAIGAYALGCMAGAQRLPMTGPDWQVMRPSRNRNWALPQTISLIERLASDAKAKIGWNGLLVGDMAQPRGGPMLTGHASHQNGLDADIWFTPMPNYEMSAKERETMVPFEMVKGHYAVNPDTWSLDRAKLLKMAASYPEVARIFVHPPIKAALCQFAAGDADKSWLAKIRPMKGHTFHFHIRLNCPAGMPGCKNQWKPKPKDGTGCGDELAYWMGGKAWQKPKPNPNAPPYVPPPPLTLSGLPAECRAVVAAP
ncbi:MAG: penicillin-insensitive murein endopeptidase [Alphaproteobacteria bacterium]|nr:penicillin-insensitive murein endopeptidase [Alphaproteobacteria bacterium]